MDSCSFGVDSCLSPHLVWRSLICVFFVASLSVSTISAASPETSDTYFWDDDTEVLIIVDTEDGPMNWLTGEIIQSEEELEENPLLAGDTPIPVYITDAPDDGISALAAGDSDRPFYGSVWIEGTASGLGTGTLYLPINYQSGYLGVTSSGSLVNVYSSSLTGYFYADSGNVYTVTMAFATTPTYRGSGVTSSQSFVFVPSDSNAVIASSDSNLAAIEYLLPYVTVLFLGVIFICLLTKSRH